VAHVDGTMVLYDKEREDGTFVPKEPAKVQPVKGTDSPGSQDGVWNPLDSILVTMPPWHPAAIVSPHTNGKEKEKDKTPKNPVSHWRVSKKQVVGSFLHKRLNISVLNCMSKTSCSPRMSNMWRLSQRTAA
jgi:catabolite repression protein CreC